MSVFCDAIITPYEMCPFMQLLDLDCLPVVTLGLAVEAGGGIIVVLILASCQGHYHMCALLLYSLLR